MEIVRELEVKKMNKQIEEIRDETVRIIAKDLCSSYGSCNSCDKKDYCDVGITAQVIYDLNYQKKSYGKWENIPKHQYAKITPYYHICSVCKKFYKDMNPQGNKYCQYCGSIME